MGDDHIIVRAIGRLQWWQVLLLPILGFGTAFAINIYTSWEFGYWSWACLCDMRPQAVTTEKHMDDSRVSHTKLGYFPSTMGATIHVDRAPEHDKDGHPAWREIDTNRIIYFYGGSVAPDDSTFAYRK